MTHTELSQVIRDYMCEAFGVLYIGRIGIEDLDPVGYKVSIYLDRQEAPIDIIADLPDDEFIPFIKEELRSRKLHKIKFYETKYVSSR